jgi:hypothetical protein
VRCDALIDQDVSIAGHPAVFLTPDGHHLCDACGRAIAGDWSKTPARKSIELGPQRWTRPRELVR